MPHPQAGPTPERLRRSQGFFEIGGDRRTGHRFRMADTPLARALMRQNFLAMNIAASSIRAALVRWRPTGPPQQYRPQPHSGFRSRQHDRAGQIGSGKPTIVKLIMMRANILAIARPSSPIAWHAGNSTWNGLAT